MKTRYCLICKNPISGRSDKKFCSSKCKTEYHTRLRKSTSMVVVEINKILARNRSILLELLGKNVSQKKIMRIILDQKKFNFKYHTHIKRASDRKFHFYCYDLAWKELSDSEIMIIR